MVGYRRELVMDHFTGWRLPVEFQVQEVVNGTGAAARLARGFAGDAPFLLTFGDIFCEPAAYSACMEAMGDGTAAVMGVKWVDDPWQGAAVYADDNGVIERVIEKPAKGTSNTHWNSAGLYALRPMAFDYLDRLTLSARGEYELTDILDRMLADGKELRIARVDGTWRDVGRPEDLAELNATDGESSK